MSESLPHFHMNPSADPELGQQYIYNAALAARDAGQTLWQVDEGEKTVSAASTSETEDEIVIEHLGSIMKGKGREVIDQIARYAIEHNKKLSAISIIGAQEYYEKLGFTPVRGISNKWTINPRDLQ
jgi:hypothetical protein